jgi:hypothetical protein
MSGPTTVTALSLPDAQGVPAVTLVQLEAVTTVNGGFVQTRKTGDVQGRWLAKKGDRSWFFIETGLALLARYPNMLKVIAWGRHWSEVTDYEVVNA